MYDSLLNRLMRGSIEEMHEIAWLMEHLHACKSTCKCIILICYSKYTHVELWCFIFCVLSSELNSSFNIHVNILTGGHHHNPSLSLLFQFVVAAQFSVNPGRAAVQQGFPVVGEKVCQHFTLTDWAKAALPFLKFRKVSSTDIESDCCWIFGLREDLRCMSD